MAASSQFFQLISTKQTVMYPKKKYINYHHINYTMININNILNVIILYIKNNYGMIIMVIK